MISRQLDQLYTYRYVALSSTSPVLIFCLFVHEVVTRSCMSRREGKERISRGHRRWCGGVGIRKKRELNGWEEAENSGDSFTPLLFAGNSQHCCYLYVAGLPLFFFSCLSPSLLSTLFLSFLAIMERERKRWGGVSDVGLPSYLPLLCHTCQSFQCAPIRIELSCIYAWQVANYKCLYNAPLLKPMSFRHVAAPIAGTSEKNFNISFFFFWELRSIL